MSGKSMVMGKRTSFVWGAALGFLVALTLIAVNDMQGGGLPGTRPATAAGAEGEDTAAAWIVVAGPVPETVQILVDGEPRAFRENGDGPPAYPVAAGPHTVALRSGLGILWSSRIQSVAGAADTLRPELGGEIIVEVQRQGPTGDLYLDDRPAGSAPGSLSDVPPGWHVASVRDGGQELYRTTVRVHPGTVSVVSVPPKPPLGKGNLSVHSRMLRETGYTASSGEPVAVDGERVGSAPVDVTLDAGFHSVRVEREGFDPLVSVLYLPAGHMRHVDADFGREDVLRVEVSIPPSLRGNAPAAIPVRVEARGESVRLKGGELFVVPQGQGEGMRVPLVASESDPRLWVAVVPALLVGRTGTLTGYAACEDEAGRTGASEIFSIPIR